jgi:hypothetical protein
LDSQTWQIKSNIIYQKLIKNLHPDEIKSTFSNF